MSPCFTSCPLLEVRGRHVAGNPGSHFHALNGLEAAGEFIELGDGLRDHLRDLYGRWGRRRLRGLVARASGGEQGNEEHNR
jgi:hypothetical protein